MQEINITQERYEKEFLTPAEIHYLTGHSRPEQQQDWLDDHGWTYAVSAGGHTIVARVHLHSKLNPKPKQTVSSKEPDWSFLDG